MDKTINHLSADAAVVTGLMTGVAAKVIIDNEKSHPAFAQAVEHGLKSKPLDLALVAGIMAMNKLVKNPELETIWANEQRTIKRSRAYTESLEARLKG
jgi:hypothetical protein